MIAQPLAATEAGLTALRRLTTIALDELDRGRDERKGPLPPGGPTAVAADVRGAIGAGLPAVGGDGEVALRTIVGAIARGAADPADPRCAAHLHAAPLAIAAAADLAASVLNPSLDSWDQAPAASELERIVTAAVGELTFAGVVGADAVVTTGATESNLVALLLARERLGARTQVFCSADAHHSVTRAAWMLGLPPAVTVPTRNGRLDVAALAELMGRAPDAPAFVVATAGTTDRGAIDPIRPIAELTRRRGGHLHVDAAYGAGLLFGSRRCALDGIEQADTVALDLHKFGWQPLPAGFLAVREQSLLAPLSLSADYLNADDDIDAGLPDLLGRSIRTSRRADVVKIAVTFRTIGRSGFASMVDRCCLLATQAAHLVQDHPQLRLLEMPTISTVLFRPTMCDRMSPAAGNALTAAVRRELLTRGSTVVGRATVAEDGLTWLKLTLLNPELETGELTDLIDIIAAAAVDCAVDCAIDCAADCAATDEKDH